MYTSPKTSFAAGFIGHYNIIPKGDFTVISKERRYESKEIAIRPETLEISNTPHEASDKAYQFIAVIKDNTLRGNVLRYTIDAGGFELKVDVLFRSFKLFDNGSEVYVSVGKHNCLEI